MLGSFDSFRIPLLSFHIDKYQETSAVEKLKKSGGTSDVDRPKNEAGTNNTRKRVRRSYGQQSNCIGITIKMFCKVFKIDNVAKR